MVMMLELHSVGIAAAAAAASIARIAPIASSSTCSSTRAYTGHVTAKALLDIVLNLKADQPANLQGNAAASGSSSSMSRSQSANATARLQQGSQVPAHMRNISTGSNRSEDDGGMISSQTSNGLSAPSHPGMARTASSRNVADSGQSNLRTIDLTHHRIADVPTEVIDALEGTVGRYVHLHISLYLSLTCDIFRLALGYNYIATLPPSFARLGNTLRYLNIRLNMLTTFPAVVSAHSHHLM